LRSKIAIVVHSRLGINIRIALAEIISNQGLTRSDLAHQLGVNHLQLDGLLDETEADLEAWSAVQERLVEVLGRYGLLPESPGGDPTGAAGCHAIVGSSSADPFGRNAEDVAAEETREKAELFAWADATNRLSGADLELELDAATKRFGTPRAALQRILRARANEKKKQDRAREHGNADAPEDNGSATTAATSASRIAAYSRAASALKEIPTGRSSRLLGSTLRLSRATRRVKTGAATSPSSIEMAA